MGALLRAGLDAREFIAKCADAARAMPRVRIQFTSTHECPCRQRSCLHSCLQSCNPVSLRESPLEPELSEPEPPGGLLGLPPSEPPEDGLDRVEPPCDATAATHSAELPEVVAAATL